MFWSFFISLLLLHIIETSSLIDNNGENKPIMEALHPYVTVTSGQKAILTCTFSSANHELSLSSSHQLIWIRQSYESYNADSILAHNQHLLITDSRLNVQRTDVEYTLTINDVNIDDEGIYACEVNTQPPQRAYVHLNVQEIPMIIDSATSTPIIIMEHDNVTMKCQARGRPTPYITWFRRNEDTKNSNNRTRLENQILANNTDGLYHLINISRHQSGHYECRASNGVNDHVVSKDIELRVLFTPSIRAQSTIVHGVIGKSTHLRCSASAPYDTSLYWRRIDNHNTSDQSNRFRQQQNTHGHLLHTTLYVKDIEKSDFGLYACYAESKAGHTKAVIELREHYRPTTTITMSTTTTTTSSTSVMQQTSELKELPFVLSSATTTTTIRAQLLKRNRISDQTSNNTKTNSAFSPSLFISYYLLILIMFFLHL